MPSVSEMRRKRNELNGGVASAAPTRTVSTVVDCIDIAEKKAKLQEVLKKTQVKVKRITGNVQRGDLPMNSPIELFFDKEDGSTVFDKFTNYSVVYEDAVILIGFLSQYAPNTGDYLCTVEKVDGFITPKIHLTKV